MGYKTLTCPISKDCGGCEWLAVPYEVQLQRKQETVEELFAGYECGVEPIIGMEEPVAYRAKVMTPFKRGRHGAIIHGMYRPGSHAVVMCEECLVEAPEAQPIIATIAQLAKKFRIPVYEEDTGRGLLRHAVIRVAQATGECMVTLVINRKEFPHKKEFVAALRDEHPEIATVVFNINTRNTNAVLGPVCSTAYGQGWLEDQLCGCTFRIPADAFYQTNPTQTEVLYQTAIRLGKLVEGETVLDAYCGIGTVGIVAVKNAKAPKVKKNKKGKAPKQVQRKHVRLIGVENLEAAAAIAAENARINKVNGAEFVAADAGAYLKECVEELDLVFMDPPRSGASEDFIEGLLQAAPKRIVYISCNPVTQLRDIQALGEKYKPTCIIPVDMFPHTKHVECVVLLSRRKPGDAV